MVSPFRFLIPTVFAALLIAMQLGLALSANHGVFTYALDDPYIHLDLAGTLASSGTYGLHAGEISSPSSSILWPFLLLPLAGTALHVILPLLLNIFCALGTVATLTQIIRRLLPETAQRDTVIVFSCIAALTLNLTGLPLMGMEHGLQMLLTLLGVLGVIDTLEGKEPRWWLWAALIIAPLVRYENIITSTALLGILLWLGYGRRALLSAAAMVLPLVVFSFWLVHLGLEPLPGSTLIKKLRWGDDYWGFLLRSLEPVLFNPPGQILLLATGVLPLVALTRLRGWRSPRWAVLAALAAVCVLHLFLGRYSSLVLPRYELYAFAMVALLLIWLLKAQLHHPAFRALAVVVLFYVSLPGLLFNFYGAGRSMHAIYLQQYQMARLSHTAGMASAANDIGLIGYQNPAYLLDLVGLANPEVRHSKLQNPHNWADALVRAHQVKLIMLYPDWYPQLDYSKWIPLGHLICDACDMTLMRPDVAFYAASEADAASLRPYIADWAATLPAGARFETQ